MLDAGCGETGDLETTALAFWINKYNQPLENKTVV